MTSISRNIDPAEARDLLERVPRACITFAGVGGPYAQPVVLAWRDPRYFIGIPSDADQQPNEGQEVVLLVDDGVYFFSLRAIYIRGHIQPTEPPPNASAYHRWFEVIPAKTVAWDYGKLHEAEAQ